jgi:hypothetical protein
MFNYFIIGILFSSLFLDQNNDYSYVCAKEQQIILTSTQPLCFYNCQHGYVNLRIDGYENNTIYYYIDNNAIGINEVVSYYYNLIKQESFYITVNDSIKSLEDKPSFGYFIQTHGIETNLFVPFDNSIKYKDIKILIKTRKMIDLYYPACVYYHNTRIGLTFKRNSNTFKSKYTIMYDNIEKYYNISKYHAILAKKVKRNV